MIDPAARARLTRRGHWERRRDGRGGYVLSPRPAPADIPDQFDGISFNWFILTSIRSMGVLRMGIMIGAAFDLHESGT